MLNFCFFHSNFYILFLYFVYLIEFAGKNIEKQTSEYDFWQAFIIAANS